LATDFLNALLSGDGDASRLYSHIMVTAEYRRRLVDPASLALPDMHWLGQTKKTEA